MYIVPASLGRLSTTRKAAALACLVAVFISMAGGASPASAGAVLDRIRSEKTIRCGATARPGLLDQTEQGTAQGLLVDLCRAVGPAVAGPDVKVEMVIYDGFDSYDRFRSGRDELVFLTGSEIVDNKLAGRLLPGPTVFHATSAIMVVDRSPVQHPADLAGQPICFLQGDVSHRHLEAFFAARHLPFVRMGYQEEVELYDAFDAQICHALAGEATTLADVRLSGGANRRSGRILAEPLADFPIIAGTGLDDAAWSAAAFWTLATLISADRPKQDWSAGGLDSLPLDAAPFGLAADWHARALAATGSYAEMLQRNIGDRSPLKLPAAANALISQGGLMTPPYAE